MGLDDELKKARKDLEAKPPFCRKDYEKGLKWMEERFEKDGIKEDFEVWKQNRPSLEDCFRILQAIQQKSLCFSEISSLLDIKLVQLDYLIRQLCLEHWIIPRTMPVKDSDIIVIKYRLGKRGILVLSEYLKQKR